MKQPTVSGLAVSESLNRDVGSVYVKSKIANPYENSKRLFHPPSLLPDDSNLAWIKGFEAAKRIYRSDSDPLLDVMRERVEQIRKKRIKKGQIKPANKQERKWRMGL